VSPVVAVLGTYQSNFKTHASDQTFVEQAQQAAVGAMTDSGMSPDDIDMIVFSLAPTFFLGVADAERWAIDHVFGAGKPFMRVHTGGATGGSAVHVASALIKSGAARSVLIVGAERIAETPDAQKVLNLIFDVFYERDLPLSTNTLVALRANRYMAKHGYKQEDIARVVVRARRNATKNPHAHLKGHITVEDVMMSKMIAYPFKLFDICPRSSGGAAMILGNMELVRRFAARPAFIKGQAGVSDTYWMGDRMCPTAITDVADYTLMERASEECYRQAGISDPLKQIQVVEFYDAYSINSPIALERTGFCGPGLALRLEREGYWNMEDGAVAVNPSGGTLCTNPIGITGLVRAIDAARQVMGRAEDIQVRGVRNALATAAGGTAQFFNCTLFGDEPSADW
jgi:acetyl-CoA C-acetyltransferase